MSDRPDIFFVAADGWNLDEVVEDVRDVLERTGLPLLARFRDLACVHRFLLHGDPTMPSTLDYGGFTVTGPARFSAHECSAIVAMGRLLGVEDPQAELERSPAFVFLRKGR